MKTMKWFYCPLVFGLLVAMLGAAPVRDNGDYAARRLSLAEETFQEIAAMCAGSDQFNLAADYVDCDRAVEARPDLRAAMLENIIFDYCNVSDSLKTDENREAWTLCGKSYFALRDRDAWNELGARYVEKRQELERERSWEPVPESEQLE